MNDWNEDNFIEKIVQLLDRRSGTLPCPEAEAFLAASDGDSGGALKRATAEHASGCPECRALQQRIESFDSPMVGGNDAEWKQTEKRLDNWLEGFLSSGAAVHQEGDPGRSSHIRDFWSRVGWPAQLRWALVPAVALALIGAFLAGRFSSRNSPLITAELQRLPVTPQTAGDQNRSEKEPTGKPQVGQTSQAAPKQGAVASSAPIRTGQSHAPPRKPPAGTRSADTAVVVLPAPSKSEDVPLSPPVPMQGPPAETAPMSPSVRLDRPVETAENSGAAASASARPGLPPSSRATSSALRSIMASRGVARAPEAKVESPPAVPNPPVITLDAGTRVWITLKSIQPRTDGVSEFRGLVLLPVTQSGTTLLGRNAEVSGTMTVRNGKRSVQILEFRSAGTQYRLRGASGEANLRLLGAGEVVQFDAGRVLETWMSAVSTYEKQ